MAPEALERIVDSVVTPIFYTLDSRRSSLPEGCSWASLMTTWWVG